MTLERHPLMHKAVSDVNQPWSRMQGEPEKAYMSFLLYRDMNPRTLKRVADARGIKSVRRLEQWSAKWKWQERAEAYEKHLDDAWIESKAGQIEQATKRIQRLMKKIAWFVDNEFDVLVERAIEEKRAKMKDPGRPRSSTVQSQHVLTRLSRDSVILTRLIYGESTENVQSGAFDPSKLSVEELATLRELQEKAKK